MVVVVAITPPIEFIKVIGCFPHPRASMLSPPVLTIAMARLRPEVIPHALERALHLQETT